MTNPHFEALLDRAHAAAKGAAVAYLGNIGGKDGWPCGFAWVTIGGNEQLARYCRAKVKSGKDSGLSYAEICALEQRYGDRGAMGKGWEWWASQWTNAQNMDVKRAAGRAFLEELGRSEIQAKVGSRLD